VCAAGHAPSGLAAGGIVAAVAVESYRRTVATVATAAVAAVRPPL
jgi:hypothetical protein